MSKIIDIMSLYPKDMNIYGDLGNVLTVRRRLSLYGYEPVIHQYNQGDDWPEHVDLILGGGGQDTSKRRLLMTSTCVPTCCARWPQTVPLCL